MITLAYYPGCTLYTKAKNLDLTARRAAEILDIELRELETWNCCGAIYSPVSDDLSNQVAPIRNLIEAQKISKQLVTLCAACYNVLKRTNRNLFLPDNYPYRQRVLKYLETSYDGSTEMIHYLEMLRDYVGFEALKTKVQKPLQGLKIASYYGCLMTRPAEEVNFDDPDNPTLMDKMFLALGAEVISYAFKSECCGGYIIVSNPEVARKCASTILENILDQGANCVATTCPLCQYSLDNQQKEMTKQYNLPVFYFTQLLGLALGISQEHLNLDYHYVDPKRLLKEKGLIV
jgi:heterodisulfide reductase subunit B